MSRKAYSEQEREALKQRLADVGLELFSKHGLKNVRLIDIVKAAGISKLIFYAFYASKEGLVIRVLEHQRKRLLTIIRDEFERADLSWEDRARSFFALVLRGSAHNILIMTQEEEIYVYQHLGRENFDLFQNGQLDFYRQMLSYFKIPDGACGPAVLGNLILSMLLVHNCAAQSLPNF